MMTSKKLLSHISSILDQTSLKQGAMFHTESGTHLLRHEAETGLDSTIYRPLLCLVLQGAKEVGTSKKRVEVHSGQSLIVSHALPVISRITKATPTEPYTALVFPLEFDLLRSLAPSVLRTNKGEQADPFSICLCETDAGLEDALLRYYIQCEDDNSRDLLAPITAREIHARLLIGRHAQVLKRLLWHETTASRIYQITQDIQSNVSKPISIGEIATRIGMSNSALFEQFKAVTGTSPLQYQKDLRLLKARNDLQMTGQKISEIAFSVGYESSAQFSREYTRKFGKSPRQDRALVN